MFLYLHHTSSYFLLHYSFISTLFMCCFFFCSLYQLFILIPISPAPVCCDHPCSLHFVKFLISFDPFFLSQTFALLFCCLCVLLMQFWIWIIKLVRYQKNKKQPTCSCKQTGKIILYHLKWSDAVQSFLSGLMYLAYQCESICLMLFKIEWRAALKLSDLCV